MDFKGIVLMVASAIAVQAMGQSNLKVSASKAKYDTTTQVKTWMADNGNGTFTNPLFYDEFSDPDLIRVGDDYYLTGTTMHAMPGLPILHSKDLVNWEFLTYAIDKLDLGPEFRLEDSKEIYGQGIWAPSFRFYNGKFFIFSNVNRKHTQIFTATNPAGPWSQSEMKVSLHDLSILFDDDGKVYAIWGYDEVKMAELTEDLMDIKPGTQQVIIPRGSGAGEGSHFYKIDGKYYITNTNYDPVCYQVCARAEKPYGPYEINMISAEENFGVGTGWKMSTRDGSSFRFYPPQKNNVGCITLHQGGIVKTQTGEWWAFSMMDHNSVGRLTCLSPVTWSNGWPYLGLPGNLTRSPLTWVKPQTGYTSKPHAPYERSDDFSGAKLKPIWQWNHVPDDAKWSLTKRKGYLCLQALPSKDFWHARNSLTQRAIGPESEATAAIDVKDLKDGDIAGVALLNYPYGWIGINRDKTGYEIRQYDQATNKTLTENVNSTKIWLRVHCNFDTEIAYFSYSSDGKRYTPIGVDFIMVFQLKTFQGVRFALFNYNENGVVGGIASIDRFDVNEPRSQGLTKPIPYGQNIRLANLSDSSVLVNWRSFLRAVNPSNPLARGKASYFKVIDRGQGRVALQSQEGGGYVTVSGKGKMSEVRIEKEDMGEASTFQWQDMLQGDLMLMSLRTQRYIVVDANAGNLCAADSPGARPDRKDGTCFAWEKLDK